MELRTRLILYISIAALVPLGFLGLGAIKIATRSMEERSSELEARTADALGIYTETWLDLQLRLLEQQVGTFDAATLEPTYWPGYLRLIYQQSPETQVVCLTDQQRVERVPCMRATSAARAAAGGRDLVEDQRVQHLLEALPLSQLDPSDGVERAAVGPVWLPPGRQAPVLPVALRFPGTDLVLGVELGLDELVERFRTQDAPSRDLALFGRLGEPIVAASGGLVDREAFRAFFGSSVGAGDVRYRTREGQEVLAATAPVPRAGWTVVVAESMDLTYAAAHEIRSGTTWLAAVAAVLSIVIGMLYARQLSVPVVALRNAALRVASGERGLQIPTAGTRELMELGRAFNHMSARLAEDQAEIEQQRVEIEAFNLELQQRVEERTRELEEAQGRLVQSARLAAVGEMGAGLAHELNNPLAGILGLAQVLNSLGEQGDSKAAMLQSIETQARRCADIVHRLIRFSSAKVEEAPVDRREWDVVDLHEVVGEVLTLVGGPLRQRGIRVVHTQSEPLKVRGDAGELARALAQLLTSLRAASADDGEVLIEGGRGTLGVELSFTLSGASSGVGGDDWMASGMGFWAAQQVLVNHGGGLEEPEGRAAPLRWSIHLPRA